MLGLRNYFIVPLSVPKMKETLEESNRYQPMIRDLPQGERPRERLKEYGPRYLSNTS